MKRLSIFFLALWVLQTAAFAKVYPPLYPGFSTLRESKAYKKFAGRTYSEFSKILYLIDRFSEAKITINYDEQTYTAAFATTVARWFLSRNYKKQTALHWINQWCNKSIIYGKPIYVKLPDGKFRLAREILLEELENLEEAIKENQAQKNPVPVTNNDVVSTASSSAALITPQIPEAPSDDEKKSATTLKATTDAVSSTVSAPSTSVTPKPETTSKAA